MNYQIVVDNFLPIEYSVNQLTVSALYVINLKYLQPNLLKDI